MVELSKRWDRLTSVKARGEWWLTAKGHREAPNRAYITWYDPAVPRMLVIWCDKKQDWIEHMESNDLKVLKSVGRIEAARRLYA